MARKKKKRNASRGSVNNIILRTLVNGDKYGYEIIKEVEEYSSGKIQLKQPSLYSSLSRFEEKKFVTSYWGDSDIGGRRHYYHLTELGLSYYRKNILKEPEDSSEVNDSDEDVNTIEASDEVVNFVDSVDGFVNSADEKMDNISISNEESRLTAIDDGDIPAIVNFNEPQEETPIIVPDHVYHSTTPIELMISSSNNSSDLSNYTTTNNYTSTDESSNKVNIDNGNQGSENPWQILAESTKRSNHQFSESNFNKLYIKKPKKEYKIIKDTDGIFKLRDSDYTPAPKSEYKPVIIDNVIKRSKPDNNFGYTTYTSNEDNTKQQPYIEMSEEEKLKRNENFLAKFNLLTNSRMKPVSSPTPKQVIEPKIEKPIDYRGKLEAIYANNDIVNNEPVANVVDSDETNENNIYNYIEQDNWNTDFVSSTSSADSDIESEEDKFVEFDDVQEFEVKTDNKQYVETINNFSSTSQIKMSRYEHTAHAVLMDKNYVLINKLKFVFGILMSIIMLAEITVSILLFNKFGLFENNTGIFIGSYILVGVFALFTVCPYIFNSNVHRANNFKFKYTLWFGVLTFIICAILIYCFNALYGFELDNFKYYAVNLILPLILSFNFVIAPIVYAILSKSKRFYD